MVEPFWVRFKRKLKQALCFHHNWYYWVDGKHRTCEKCDKTEVVK